MVRLTREDLVVIKNVYDVKKWTGADFCREFPLKKWDAPSVNYAIRRYKDTGSIFRRKGSGRPRTVTTKKNQTKVDALSESQESHPGTHKSVREISRRLHYSKSSVYHVILFIVDLIRVFNVFFMAIPTLQNHIFSKKVI